jgi:hypothetical protein
MIGGKIGAASIEEKLPASDEELLKSMKSETFGELIYEFCDEEIGNCRIHNKV